VRDLSEEKKKPIFSPAGKFQWREVAGLQKRL
jgi:hypothetical protein